MNRNPHSWRLVGASTPSRSVAFFRSSGAPFGQRQRGVGHPTDLQALLGPGGGDRTLEVGTRLLGVVALGGAGAEDRLGRRLVASLGLELLVGPALHLLHGGELAALLDSHGALLLGHRS